MAEPILLTHTDLDGIGCGVVFRGVFGPGSIVSLVENGAIDTRVNDALAAAEADPRSRPLWVTDHAVSDGTAERVDRFLDMGGQFTLLDHHRSSRHLIDRPWATVDDTRSATSLLFDRLGRPDRFAEFVSLVEDHDLWRHADPRSAQLSALVGLLGHDRFLGRFSLDPAIQFSEGERLLIDTEDRRKEDYLAKKSGQARLLDLAGARWAVCYAEQYQSDLAERLMVEHGVGATAIVNPGKRTVSLRGQGVDVAPLAEAWGGGGHSRAAAFTFAGSPLEIALARFESELDRALSGD
ncbi:MAG TPA: hypothetical protein VG015_01745 [Candidatus Dormibacteraeota bacterium]|nr:hypothetical protein [Candidatus Dormibacteraeota bacterium]